MRCVWYLTLPIAKAPRLTAPLCEPANGDVDDLLSQTQRLLKRRKIAAPSLAHRLCLHGGADLDLGAQVVADAIAAIPVPRP